MATVAGNTRVVYLAIQTAKGAPAAAPTHKLTLTGDVALDPNREIVQLPQTDASSQAPNNVVVGASPGGGWQGWLRPSEFALLARLALGVNGDSGAGPYVHTATPTQAMPYFTAWDVLPGSLCTRFDDCRLGSLGWSGESLQGIQYQVGNVLALAATLNVAEPAAPAASATDRELVYPDVQVSLDAVHPGTHDSFAITINRNLTAVRGDNGLAIFDIVPGLLQVEGTFRRIYESDDVYNEFHGGSAAATGLVTTIFTEALDIAITRAEDTHGVAAHSDAIEYTETTVPVNTDGTPVIMNRSFRTKRQATVSDNISVVTTNGLATTETSPA